MRFFLGVPAIHYGEEPHALGTLRNLMDHGVFITPGGKRALKLGPARGMADIVPERTDDVI